MFTIIFHILKLMLLKGNTTYLFENKTINFQNYYDFKINDYSLHDYTVKI